MRKTRVHRDHRKGGDQHNGHTPRSQVNQQQQNRGGSEPHAQFADQVIQIRVDADLGADAVENIVENVAPHRGERVAECRPIEDRAKPQGH